MQQSEINQHQKDAIISEYLLGGITYRKLAEKYNMDFRKIHYWVTKFTNRPVKKTSELEINPPSHKDDSGALPPEVRALQEELRKTRLHNELLNTMIDIAEEQLKIDIRKKSGTRR